ncbi:transcription factor 25-like [Lytechinus variegatus]|uniref:transcription factor 25-like n=1 Tax=Lytechinus variegatus TaxID=7654 RepID=UPI001BB1E87D|nr:transcription factor 25-like [Lytechinus variegatus]XP_041454565.1 transcription factor 25-like [Lytechinus variegatus]
MSSRAMRKLCYEPDIVLKDEVVNDEEEEIEDGEVQVAADDVVRPKKPKGKKKKKVINPFELLNDIEDAQSDGEEDAELPEDQNEKTDKTTEGLQNGLDVQTATEVKSKKKKKKKKKKQKGGTSSGQADDEDEIDASIREVNEILKTSPPLSTNVSSSSLDQGSRLTNSKPLLAIEHKHLNPENELRRIFGASVIRNEQRQRGRNRQYQKATWLVTAKQSWPKMTKTGLSMIHITTEGRYHIFEYEHSKDYQNIQFDFLDAVETMNPANIMAIMNAHPYHIDSLLQLSEVSRINEDMGMAIDLIERALYVYESAFHTLFSLAEGTCQISYRHAENRGLFIALFRHLTCLGQKGCNRTALEFCKLLLGFEPDKDPLGVLLMLDYYALKTDQYDYLIRMYAEWEAHRNLSQLPNWAFSIAMAYFYSISSSSSPPSSSSSPPDTTKADSLLQDALIMFPSVLLALLEKCSIQPDATIASHTFFTQSTTSHSALTQLVDLFIARNYSFWKESESMAWLERNAREVIRRVDAGEQKVKEYAEKREARYHGTPRNIYRHIFLSEHLGIKLKLPPELANTPVMSFDPLPPKDSDMGYSRPDHRLRPVSRGRAGNMITEFLRSIVPSYTPPPPGEAGANDNEGDEDLGAAGGYLSQNSNLRQGVGAVMEAMRELLQTLEPLQRPGDNSDEEQGGGGGPQLEELD